MFGDWPETQWSVLCLCPVYNYFPAVFLLVLLIYYNVTSGPVVAKKSHAHSLLLDLD